MEVKNILTLKVKDSSHVYEARRVTAIAANSLGFSESDIGRISIIVSEMVTNLVKHSDLKSSTFIAQEIITKYSDTIELISIDQGPGIKNLSESLRDGFSTAGSSGTGLGSISRLSDHFDIFSQQGIGTVVLSQVRLAKRIILTDKQVFSVGSVCIPKPGEEVNGDKWAFIELPNRFLVIAVDGLGHGPDAAKASQEAVNVFEESHALAVNDIMLMIHKRLRPTRGAAAAITEITPSKGLLKFCSIGNISGSIINSNSIKNLVSYNGIVGYEEREIHVAEYPWSNESTLLLHSDGIISRWNIEKYPGLARKSLTTIAAVFYRDFQRGNDDLLVILVRNK